MEELEDPRGPIIDRMLEQVAWTEEPDATPGPEDVPYVTHRGWLYLDPVVPEPIEVVQLSDGRRVIPTHAFEALCKALGFRLKSDRSIE